MAKVKHLAPVNKTTWNLKVIPNNANDIIKKMRDILAIDEIIAVVSIVGDNMDTYVLTPTNILYQFTLNVKTDDFDKDWWAFALRNYYVVFANSFDKSLMIDLVEIESKDVKGKVVQKGKSSGGLSGLSLIELLDLACS